MLFNFIQKEESQVIPKKFKTISVENWFGFFWLVFSKNEVFYNIFLMKIWQLCYFPQRIIKPFLP